MKKEIEIQQENINNLIKLAKENPNLEIIPMVDSEVVSSDDFNCWRGKWGKAEIDEIYCEDERIYFKSSDFEELVDEYIERYEGHLINEIEIEEWAEEQVKNLPWEKVITVNIKNL